MFFSDWAFVWPPIGRSGLMKQCLAHPLVLFFRVLVLTIRDFILRLALTAGRWFKHLRRFRLLNFIKTVLIILSANKHSGRDISFFSRTREKTTHRSNPKRHNQLRQPHNHRPPRPLRNLRKSHIRQIPIQHNPRLNIRLPRPTRHKRMQSRARLTLDFRMRLVQS